MLARLLMLHTGSGFGYSLEARFRDWFAADLTRAITAGCYPCQCGIDSVEFSFQVMLLSNVGFKSRNFGRVVILSVSKIRILWLELPAAAVLLSDPGQQTLEADFFDFQKFLVFFDQCG